MTAVSWGPYRAEFVGPVENGHTVRIRLHDSQRADFLVDVTVRDDTEVGLREALLAYAQDRREDAPLHDADERWHGRVNKRPPPPRETRTKKATKRKTR